MSFEFFKLPYTGRDKHVPYVSPPAPRIELFSSTEQSYTANCAEGLSGSSVTVTIPAGAYTSFLSQADADGLARALAVAQAEGQLVCLPPAAPQAISFVVSSDDDGLNGLTGQYLVYAILSETERVLLGQVEIPLFTPVDITAMINASPIVGIPGASRRIMISAITDAVTERLSTTNDNLSTTPVVQEFIELLGLMNENETYPPVSEGFYGVIDIPAFDGCEVSLAYYLPPPS